MGIVYDSEHQKRETFIFKNGDYRGVIAFFALAPVAVVSIWFAYHYRSGVGGMLAIGCVGFMIWAVSGKCQICGRRYLLGYLNGHFGSDWFHEIMHSKICLNPNCPSRHSSTSQKAAGDIG